MGIVLAIICGIIIFGELNSVASVESIVVPIMSIAYLILAF
ncbi:MAG: alanine:cation symporter family protein [Arsenophonus sp.]